MYKKKDNYIKVYEEEVNYIDGDRIKTGRKRKACNYLECPSCFSKESVDNTFAGKWY